MGEEKTILRLDDANKLLASADGTAALLYLHILTEGGRFSISAAARDLRRSELEIAHAADLLRKLGLMPKPPESLPRSELPDVTAQDIVQRAQTDGAFRDLVSEAEKSLGHILSSSDLATLFGIYDHLGLPADVIMLLLHHCIEDFQARNGPGRIPTMRFIEKEAWFWADQEILSIDAAEAHLRRCRERQALLMAIKDTLQIRSRGLTPSERKYVESWIAMGFGADAVAIAYDRTVLNTGKLTWKYMDSIMKSWDGKRLYKPEDIERGDPARRPRRSTAAAPADTSQKIDRMRRMYDSMKNPDGKKEG